MDTTATELKKQTEKWLKKLENERKAVATKRKAPGLDVAMENLDAYISDTHHFMKEGDWVRAFEAVIYAWGILETLRWLEMA